MRHCFAVCAYGDSPYVQRCLDSLAAQTQPSPILLCTATPSAYLEALARRYGAAYRVNAAPPGIGSDWDFALEAARAAGFELATLCHQDDIYLPEYGAAACQAAAEDLLIYFSDYGEQRGEAVVTRSRLLDIKRALLLPLRIRGLQSSVWARRRCLSLGNPICCPAVTYHLPRLPAPLFTRDMTTSLDWEAWERISRLPGRFAYDPQVRMLHRIHPQSTTSQVLGQGGRRPEDYAMFRRFWPAPLASLLGRLYAASEDSNRL